MLMKQVQLKQDDGAMCHGWIDKDHAVIGHRFDLNLGEGKRSSVMQVVNVWHTERDLTEIQEQDANRRGFGGSIR